MMPTLMPDSAITGRAVLHWALVIATLVLAPLSACSSNTSEDASKAPADSADETHERDREPRHVNGRRI